MIKFIIFDADFWTCFAFKMNFLYRFAVVDLFLGDWFLDVMLKKITRFLTGKCHNNQLSRDKFCVAVGSESTEKCTPHLSMDYK